MSLFVEIMCDVRSEGASPESVIEHRCWTNAGDNPQGGNIAIAKASARESGWKLGPRHKAVCPGCIPYEKAARP